MKLNIQGQAPYSIFIGKSIHWHDFAFNRYSMIVVIGDANVLHLYSEKIKQNIGRPIDVIGFPAGEAYKTRETKAKIEDELFQLGCGRDSVFIALGGGITLDLVGFIAATFCRGVDVIYIPTSLLAMVDASLGGKTAVNTAYGKNLIGCFSNPQSVWIDVKFLETLPKRDFISGMAEVIKHAFIADKEFLKWLKVNKEKIYALDISTVEQMIVKSTEIKQKIVEQDEFERGMREALNFGHTIGHVIETLSNYTVSHGEAVAMGMMFESYISHLMGFLSYEDYLSIKDALVFFKLPTTTRLVRDFDLFIQTISFDKKVKHGDVYMILLEKIGQVHQVDNQYSFLIPKETIKIALKELC